MDDASSSKVMMETQATRVFEPPYAPTGDVALDRLAFFHVIERLKVCMPGFQATRSNLSSILLYLADSEAHRMGKEECTHKDLVPKIPF